MTTKISTLPSLATVTDATIIPVVEGGATKKITGAALKTYTGTASGPQGPSGPSGAAGSNGASGPQGPTGPVAGSTTQVIYNSSGSAAGSSKMTFDGNTLTLSPTATIGVRSIVSADGYSAFDATGPSNGDRYNINPRGSGYGTQIWSYNNAQNAYAPITVGASSYSWKVGSTEKLSLTTSGYVAINVGDYGFTPAYNLHTVGGNVTTEPASLIRATRGYNQHPGATNFNAIYGEINGFYAGSVGSAAGVYGKGNPNNSAGVTGDSDGGVTDFACGVVGIARHSNTDGYAINNAFYARCDLPTAGGGNGGVRGLYIKLPNYAKSYGIDYESGYTGSNTQNILTITRNGSGIGSITTTASATAYNTSSDYRLKENPVKITTGLADVMQMNPVKFTWRSNGTEGIGFIAHELQAVVPQAVHGVKDEVKLVPELDSNGIPLLDANGNNVVKTEPVYQGVDSSFLVATLVAAIQELKAEFDAYRTAHP